MGSGNAPRFGVENEWPKMMMKKVDANGGDTIESRRFAPRNGEAFRFLVERAVAFFS
jgi:hypothetical protein